MEDFVLHNEFLEAGVSLTGAEITRVTTKDGEQLLWEGAPAVWGHVSPLLFPFPGPLWNGYYLSGGRKYPLNPGGFVMDCAFTVLDRTDHQAILQLRFPVREYPFEVDLLAAYTLKERRLMMEYNLVNRGFAPVYYGLGRQFAIACPEGTEFQRLIFDVPESPAGCTMSGGFLSDEPVELGRGIQQLSLTGGHFPGDCLFLSGLKGNGLTVLSLKTGRRVRVDFDGFDYVRIWKRHRAQFLSIEPWTTLPDGEAGECLLSRKPGIQLLQPGKTKQYKHIVSLFRQ